MRRTLAETRKVRAGDLVRISLYIEEGCDLGRVTIWSRQDGDDFSPYVDESKIEASNVLERPVFLRPMEFRLTEKRRQASGEFRSEVGQYFRIVQEIDANSDPKVKARITKNGKAAETLGWFCRNSFGPFGDFAFALFRKKQRI